MADPNIDVSVKRSPATYVIAAGAAIGMVGVGMAIAGLPILGAYGALAIMGTGCLVSTCGILWKNKLDLDAINDELSGCELPQHKVAKDMVSAGEQHQQDLDPVLPRVPLKVSGGRGRS